MANDTATTVISWTPELLTQLDARLKEAGPEEVINFQGHEIYVPYGQYLSDYLHSQFNP